MRDQQIRTCDGYHVQKKQWTSTGFQDETDVNAAWHLTFQFTEVACVLTTELTHTDRLPRFLRREQPHSCNEDAQSAPDHSTWKLIIDNACSPVLLFSFRYIQKHIHCFDEIFSLHHSIRFFIWYVPEFHLTLRLPMLDFSSRSNTSSDHERTASSRSPFAQNELRFHLLRILQYFPKNRMMAATVTLLAGAATDAKNTLVSHSLEMTKRKNQENLLSTIKKEPVQFLSANPQQLPMMAAFEAKTNVSTSDALTRSPDQRQGWVFFTGILNKDRECSSRRFTFFHFYLRIYLSDKIEKQRSAPRHRWPSVTRHFRTQESLLRCEKWVTPMRIEWKKNSPSPFLSAYFHSVLFCSVPTTPHHSSSRMQCRRCQHNRPTSTEHPRINWTRQLRVGKERESSRSVNTKSTNDWNPTNLSKILQLTLICVWIAR